LRARAIESADQARMAAWHKRCGALREELVARQLYFRLLDPGAPAA
jgi:hypothetical protein